MAYYKTNRREFILTLISALGGLSAKSSPLHNFIVDFDCNHSPDLQEVNNSDEKSLIALLKKCCRALGVEEASYSIKMVSYLDGSPYLNAQTCPRNQKIWLGNGLWEIFKEYRFVIEWVILHEIGHNVKEANHFNKVCTPINKYDSAFLKKLPPSPRNELFCDRVAMVGMLAIGYNIIHIREAIILMARVQKSPDYTTSKSSHPGYRDRLLNVNYFFKYNTLAKVTEFGGF